MEPLSLRISLSRLRAVGTVAELGSFSRAARQLNRSQSAISRAVIDLERSLGLKFFERGGQTLHVTPAGRAALARHRECSAELAACRAALRGFARGAGNALLRLEVSERTLLGFLAIYELRDVGAAAASRAVTRAAIYAAVAKLEKLLGTALFERADAHHEPTFCGHLLARHAGLICAILAGLEDELASLPGMVRGRVVIGTLPYSRTLLTPRAIDSVLRMHPQLRIATREGPYTSLLADMHRGRVDVIVGALRDGGTHSGQRPETLLQDELAIVASGLHPSVPGPSVDLETLLSRGWILPVAGTPARQLFRDYLTAKGLNEPREIVETSSLSLVRGLLLESDRVALLSRHQIHYDERSGLLRVLPLRLENTARPIGLTTRETTAPTPALGAVLAAYRSAAAQLAETS